MHGSPLLGLKTTRVGGTLVVRVRGELDRFTAPELGRALQEAAAPGLDIIVVLADITYLDMGGIRVLEAGANAVRERGRAFVVAEPAAVVRRIMEIVGLDRVVPAFSTLDDALTNLAPRPSASDDAPPPGENSNDA